MILILTRLSSKGQLVIPKAIREAMKLRKGTVFRIQINEGKLILEPMASSPINALYGRYSDVDLLNDLEEEHKREVMGEEEICG